MRTEYRDEFWSDILLCDDHRSTRDEECTYEVRDQESLVLLLQLAQCASSPSLLPDKRIKLV